MQTDLTFITNEENKCLVDRFKSLIKDTRLFDALVGYFFTSGFHALYKSLEPTEKIRVLIGISTDRETLERIHIAKADDQLEMKFSHKEAKDKFGDSVASEMDNSEDNPCVEEGVYKFIEWLRSGKLEIRAYPTANIHAKLYIMTFAEGDRDRGRVITGSSNFTQAGLRENLEFNVELKNPSDYDFALAKFNELWRDAVDVKDQYIEAIQTRTWLNDTITPQELYLKFLYEYFKDYLGRPDKLPFLYTPGYVKRLAYQEEAVLNAQKILDEFGGVFISDVVGLGKTYIAAMLAQQFPKNELTLVVAPPVLVDKDNPGSWPNVFREFRVLADFESLGQLDKILRRGIKYDNIIIDEAHRFRTESNITYEKLAQICRGKRVILVTATPYNNRPQDILSQIKLFQKAKRSTIPNLPNLEAFFNALQKRLKPLDRQADYSEYVKVVKENAKEIREKVLKYLMVRRTRAEIVRYFARDLEEQKLKFPDVADPEPIFYQFSEKEGRIFTHTIDLVANKFKYARYKPLLYYTGADQPDQLERQSQENMGRFMKILLVKRLESSFYAFKNTIGRFITSYQRFLEELDKGFVYVSKEYRKIFELLENDDEAAVQRLIDEGKAEKYPAEEFKPKFKPDLEHDLAILLEVEKLWQNVSRDPKLLAFKEKLASTAILKTQQLIIFTEFKETAQYLKQNLEAVYPGKVLCYPGGSTADTRDKVIENFDAGARFPKDDYRILVSTEVLSEGVNLHRSNVVINYDIPWNPTRMMQRVGRINRVDTGFDKIYSFNFFPTKQSNDQIKLKEAAEAKIHAFISLLGADARLLTEGEPIESHELFSRLISKKTITGEDDGEESELKYLKVIKEVRDKHPDLFERIKRLPKKARTARAHPDAGGFLVTYFRKGKTQKFFQASSSGEPAELDFLSAAKMLEADASAQRESVPKDYYALLDRNKEAFKIATSEEILEAKTKGGRDSAAQVLRILKAKEIRKYQGYTDEDELYIQRVITEFEAGGIPKQTSKTLMRVFDKGIHPLSILDLLKQHIPDEFLTDIAPTAARTAGPREVILSEYFVRP